MKTSLRRSLGAALALGAVPVAIAQSPVRTTLAAGPFDVKMTPQSAEGAAVGRYFLEKRYLGDLEGSSTGEMLTALTSTKGSAGYVAIERFSGKLAGHSGTFCLQHSGTMNRGTPTLLISVVPDSGTGELAGLTGTMNIQISADGTHAYSFSYSLPEKR